MNKKINVTQKKILKLSQTQDLTKLSLRDIGSFIGEKHPQTVKYHLLQLQKKGLINLEKKYEGNIIKKFNYIKNNSSLNFINIPILGEVNCGAATIFSDSSGHAHDNFVKVSPSIIRGRKEIYALQAVGSSMNNADIDGNTINEGDYVLVDSTIRKPQNGDYIISIIDNCANAKKIIINDNQKQILLVSESTDELDPIVIHCDDYNDYLVAGKIFNVIKT